MNLKIIFLIIIFLVGTGQCKRADYPDGMWPLNIFGEFLGGQQKILAYFDFNRDRFVDLVTLSNGDTLNIYLWSDWRNKFEVQTSLSTGGLKILSVIPTNFTYNERVDLLVTFEPAEGNLNQAVVYEVECDFEKCGIAGSSEQPFLVEMLPTVMYAKGKNIIVYSNGEQIRARTYHNSSWQDNAFASSTYFSSSERASESLCKNFINFHYLDYSGDCHPDIIIHCTNPSNLEHHFQFLRVNQNGKFQIFKDVYPKISSTVLSLAISDINFDGLVDLLVLFKDSTSNSQKLFIEIHYNIGIKNVEYPCKLISAIKENQFFPYHFISEDGQISQNGVLKIQRLNLNFNFDGEADYILRMGDVNNDGYVDMIVDSGVRAKIYVNLRCLENDCGSFNPLFMAQAEIINIRKFSEFSPNGLAQNTVDFCSMSFFDFYEDGHLDIMATECQNDLPLRVGKIKTILNSMALDAFFMKITILSNPSNKKIKENRMDLNLNSYGAHVDLFVTSLSGERIPACGNQLSNPGTSLQLPYIHLGLGRTNNYVEDLAVFLYRSATIQSQIWTPIVPNSQLTIVPGPTWILQTFISPTEIMGIVFWFVVLTLVGIGFVIIKLTRKQKLEDKENEESFYAILR